MTARPPVRTLLAAAGVSRAALVLSARGGGSAGTGAAADDASGASGTLSHVHGLGVDPADGRVYAAGHYRARQARTAGAVTRRVM